MKLNPDCVRDVLLEIEKLHKVSVDEDNFVLLEPLWIEQLYNALPKYCKEDIFYSLYNLDQAGYISISMDEADDAITSCAVNGMTYNGHEFLEKIRDAKHWKFFKSAGGAIRNFSLDAINQIANGATSALITAWLEKNNPLL